MKTLTGDVYSIIRRRVASGKLVGGTRISELALSKELGVSRGPVREAVMRLTGEGLLEHVPSAGTFVKEMSRRDLEEIYQLRLWLEGEAAGEAAAHITDRELVELQSCCEAANQPGDSEVSPEYISRIAVADLSFHITIMKASKNVRAVKILMDQHMLSSLIGRAEGSWELPSIHETCEEHFAILQALRNRDSVLARELMKNHITKALEDALDHYDRRAANLTAIETLGIVPAELEKLLRDAENQQRDKE